MEDFLKPGIIIPAVIMVVSFIGMLMCAKKQRTNPRAQLYAIILLIVIMICGATILVKTMGGGETKALIANEMKYARAAAVIMGRYLAKTYPGRQALIITDQNYEKNKRQQSLIDGLKEGFGTSIMIGAIDYPKPPVPKGAPPDMPMMMMMEMATAVDFDKVIDAHKNCKIIVSLIGLPYDVGNMKLWKLDPKKRPKVALMFGEIYDKAKEIAAGALSACITYKPGIKFTEEPAPDDPQVAFDKRYLLITPKNIVTIVKKYPNLFQIAK